MVGRLSWERELERRGGSGRSVVSWWGCGLYAARGVGKRVISRDFLRALFRFCFAITETLVSYVQELVGALSGGGLGWGRALG
jgi:hypothetical protein